MHAFLPTSAAGRFRGATWLATALQAACLAPAARAAELVDFTVARWVGGAGADGRTYAIVIVSEPWSWREAQQAAAELGGTVASTPDVHALSFVIGLASRPGAFQCAGPWVGGFRFAGAPWQWNGGSTFVPFAWAPGRPAQAAGLDAATCLGGIDRPDGTLVDALPAPEAGAVTRSAILVWQAFDDCDADGAPDRLQIARSPGLDGNLDGRLDSCDALPADLDHDGRVSGSDLSLLLGAWGPCPAPCPADITRDGLVNGSDLTQLLGSWAP